MIKFLNGTFSLSFLSKVAWVDRVDIVISFEDFR